MLNRILAAALGMMIVSPAFAAVYDIDPVHSTIGFAVKHMVVATTRGQFNVYTGVIEYDPADLSVFKVDMTIDVASIDTNNENRDIHLKSVDFFDAAIYPSMMFNNAALVAMEVGGTAIVGDLTIKGVTKKITIPVEIAGPVANLQGGEVLGISGETTIDRQDFGVSFSKIMETGGLMVDNNVKLVIEIEAHSK